MTSGTGQLAYRGIEEGRRETAGPPRMISTRGRESEWMEALARARDAAGPRASCII